MGLGREVVLVQYTMVISPLYAVAKNLGCICVKESSSDEMEHSACGKALKHHVVKVRSCIEHIVYRLKRGVCI